MELEPHWFEDDTRPTCRAVVDHARLIQETNLHHPIILSADGRVMDGMHRVARAYLEGQATIEAVQFEVDPEPDYVDVDLDDLPYDEATWSVLSYQRTQYFYNSTRQRHENHYL